MKEELTTSQTQLHFKPSVASLTAMKKAFHVSKQKKKILLCGGSKEKTFVSFSNCKALCCSSIVVQRKKKRDCWGSWKRTRNELAIYIHLCRLVKALESEVIQKENVLEVIFYESIKAVKASADSHWNSKKKTELTLQRSQDQRKTQNIDLKTLFFSWCRSFSVKSFRSAPFDIDNLVITDISFFLVSKRNFVNSAHVTKERSLSSVNYETFSCSPLA